MTPRAVPASRALLRALPFTGLIPWAVSAAQDTGTLGGLFFPEVLPNLLLACSIVLLFIFGIYAYASLARFAPYHTWIYLYLVSLSGVAWALFLVRSGGSPGDVAFLLTTVIGMNLIVHVLRFDRVVIPSPFGPPAAARG